jgi:hypothetical protein
MFTKLFLDTTNPKLQFIELFKPTIFLSIIASVIFHTTIYTAFFNLVNFIFNHKLLSQKTNTALIVSLLIIMSFGFIARFYHVKDIYKAYDEDLQKTRSHLDKLYISWLFIS